MNLIVCIDKNNGLMFNGRRQSQDRVLREKILAICDGAKLWMNAYSAKQFEECSSITIAANFLQQVSSGEYAFVEDGQLPELSSIEQILVFRWNRRYPADIHFNLDLKAVGLKKYSEEEFVGASHDKITLKIYKREEK